MQVSLRNAVLPVSLSVDPPRELQHKAIFNGSSKHPGQGGHVVVAELLITLCLVRLHIYVHMIYCDEKEGWQLTKGAARLSVVAVRYASYVSCVGRLLPSR